MGKRIFRIVLRAIFYVTIATAELFFFVALSIRVGANIVPQNLVIGSILAAIILAIAITGLCCLGKLLFELLFRFLDWLNDES